MEVYRYTFKPNINPAPGSEHDTSSPVAVNERCLDWVKQKDKRISGIKEAASRKELEDCTFKPRVNKPGNVKSLKANYNNMNTRSIEKFLDRQSQARSRKIVDEEYKKRTAGSGLNWRNKVTKPKSPKNLSQNSSMKFLQQVAFSNNKKSSILDNNLNHSEN